MTSLEPTKEPCSQHPRERTLSARLCAFWKAASAVTGGAVTGKKRIPVSGKPGYAAENAWNSIHCLLLVGLVMLQGQVALGQPNPSFTRAYTFNNNSSFEDVYPVSNGDYIACGLAAGNVVVVRTDDAGREIWIFSENAVSGVATTIIETDNGDFICGGIFGNRFGALRLSGEGELRWSRDYSTGSCRGVIELKDGNLLLCGSSNFLGQLVMINGDGEVIWQRTYDNRERCQFECLRQASESSVIAAGNSNNIIWAVKVDLEDGDILWSNRYWQSTAYVWSITSTHNNMFAITGFISYWEHPTRPFMLVIDQDGNETRGIEYAINQFHDRGAWTGRSIARSRDGGFVISGYLTVPNNPDLCFCLRTNSVGQVTWMREIDFGDDEFIRAPGRFRGGVFDRDDCIVAVGYATNEETGNTDAVMVKLVSDIPTHRDIRISPQDTLLTILDGSRQMFSVEFEGNRNDGEFSWTLQDSVVSVRDFAGIQFDDMGDYLVTCRIHFDQLTIPIRWHITVTDLFIVSHSPDTLDLTLRRGSSVDFAIDSVAAIQAEDTIQYQWTLNDLDRQEEEDRGQEPQTTVDFERSGHYIVEGMAYRGDSHDEVVWDVEVRGAIWSFLPEELNVVSLESDNVEFQIIPTISDSLNWYTWLYDGGMIREGWDSVFVMNFFELGEHTITGVLADSVESDSVSWTVLVESNSVPPSLSLEPSALSLSASPNPFNSMLMIRFSTGSQAAPTRLAVYDLSGREVTRLLDNSKLQALNSKLNWDASAMPAGVYLVRLQQGNQISSRKVVLLR